MKSLEAIYNPHQLDEEQFKRRFIVRKQLLNTLVSDIIETGQNETPRHHIIQGLRGQGKSSLLRMIYLRVKENSATHNWLIPLLFNEEEYSINQLCKLWERTAELLEHNPGFEYLIETYDSAWQQPNYSKDCFQILNQALIENDSFLLLLIDNIGDILNKFKKKEIQQLREILTSSKRIRIVGASSVMLEQSYDHSQPFYQFFRNHQLDGLDKPETETLLLNLGDKQQTAKLKNIIDEEPGRIEALRRLTSGVPRTIILLFDILLDNDGSAFTDLDNLLDRVTPLYKHRMDDLPSQQQLIVETIALAWDSTAVREIASKTRLQSKQVSAQLSQLIKNNIIESVPTSTKNNLYRLKERFFNIWYLMRHGRRSDKTRTLWLVRFLQEWCNTEERRIRAISHIETLKQGKLNPQYGCLMSTSLLESGLDDRELESRLIQETQRAEPGFKFTATSKDQQIEIQLQEAAEHYQKGDFDTAFRLTKPLADTGITAALFNLAILYQEHFKSYDEADKYYLMAIDEGHTDAMNNLALLYEVRFERYDEAEKYYLMAVGKGHTDAMYNLAILYQEHFERYDEAEKYYLMAIDKEDTGAMNNLANLYRKHFERYDEAEKYYLMAIDKGHTASMNNLAILYQKHSERYDEAEKYYLMAIDKGDTGAMNNLAVLYISTRKNPTEALKFARQAANNGDSKLKLFLIICLLWNRDETTAIDLFKTELKDIDLEIYQSTVLPVLAFFLAARQTAFLLKLFEREEFSEYKLRDRFAPFYFAILKSIGPEKENELKRMRPELKETVEEILQQVEELKSDYLDL